LGTTAAGMAETSTSVAVSASGVSGVPLLTL
jgi:hypothetical protein